MRFLIDMSASSFFIRKKKINKFHSGPKIESVFGSLDPTYMEESGAYEVREERDGLTKRNIMAIGLRRSWLDTRPVLMFRLLKSDHILNKIKWY